MQERFETDWGGKKLTIETGKLAAQADGSCIVRYGDTMVLATVVMSRNPREGIDFLPLAVEYEERLYAAGKIKSSRFIKREGRPSDEAILTGRLIDRSLRPLFDDRIRNELQVITTVLSVDGENDSDIMALIGASCAVTISDIPWKGPIAGLRVGRVGGEWVLNPTYAAREKSDLDLVLSFVGDKLIMAEAGASEVNEKDMYEAVLFGQKHARKVITLIEEVRAKVGKTKRAVVEAPTSPDELKDREESELVIKETESLLAKKMDLIFADTHATKAARREMIGQLKALVDEHLKNLNYSKEKRKIGVTYVYGAVEAAISRMILEEEKRVDGRGIRDIRALSAEVGLVPRTHGSSLFSRGETQVLSAVTLGAPSLEQTLDGMELSGKKHYFHHYNFPPYSVGETGRMFGPGRREIGHGALAERAIQPMMPLREAFPYTIRVVSEVLSSNGSSSMGSTCAATLALMDAGVPIKKPVAGIAMGLASGEGGAWKVITDLQDLEDADGGMDFKIAGTRDGITAVQMDTKTAGLSMEIVQATLEQAREARLQILDVMTAAIAEPRKELSQYAPRIISLRINPEKIRDVIGPGGKMINEIIDKTGATIDIEDDGLVMITSVSAEAGERAAEWVRSLTREVKVGEIFEGKVVRILDFGAFVEILPKQDGMVHISELDTQRVARVSDVVNIGDMVKVKVIAIDDLGRINLSRRALLPGGDAPRPPREDGGDDRGSRPRRPFGGGHRDR
ncbi:MAG: polyribonucleotide nucleotidyltransferase [Patescibacteria group bacterium]